MNPLARRISALEKVDRGQANRREVSAYAKAFAALGPSERVEEAARVYRTLMTEGSRGFLLPAGITAAQAYFDMLDGPTRGGAQ